MYEDEVSDRKANNNLMASKTHSILQNLNSKTIIYNKICSSQVLIPLLQKKKGYFNGGKKKTPSVSIVYTFNVQ